jgi:ABC-type uncharacterized transport system permease subunit
VSPTLFSWVLFAGASAIALWIVARFPRLAPASARGVTGWLAGAIAAFLYTPQAIMLVGRIGGRMAAAMLVALPSGVCIMLAVAWMMLWVIRGVQPYRR